MNDEWIKTFAKSQGIGDWKSEIKGCDPTDPNTTKSTCLKNLKFIDDVRATNVFHDVRNAISRFLKNPNDELGQKMDTKFKTVHRDLIRLAIASLWGQHELDVLK